MTSTNNPDANSSFFYPGPEPVLVAPSLEASVQAESALDKARKLNLKAGKIVAGVTPSQATVLMDWMVNRTRQALAGPGVGGLDAGIEINSPAGKDFFAKESFEGACGYGQGAIGHQAEMLSLDYYCHQIANLTVDGASGGRHGFSVVAIPVVQPDGSAVNRPFLIDTTFRQFCVTEKTEIGSRQAIIEQTGEIVDTKAISYTNWGAQLIKTPEGKVVVDSLLRNGYIEMTPEVARLYVSGAQVDRTGAPVTSTRPDIERLLLRESNPIDYSIEEMTSWKRDLRPPSMVQANAPLEEMIARASERAAQAVGTDASGKNLWKITPSDEGEIALLPTEKWTEEARKEARRRLSEAGLSPSIDDNGNIIVTKANYVEALNAQLVINAMNENPGKAVQIYEAATEWVQNNKKVVEALISHNPGNISHVIYGDHKNDLDISLKVVTADGRYIHFLSPERQKDPQVVRAALDSTWLAGERIDRETPGYLEFMREVSAKQHADWLNKDQHNGVILSEADQRALVNESPRNMKHELQYVSENIQLEMVKSDPKSLDYCSDYIQLKMLSENGLLLEHITNIKNQSYNLKMAKQEAAFQQNPQSLQYADEYFQYNKIKENPVNLNYVDEDTRKGAILDNPEIEKYLADPAKPTSIEDSVIQPFQDQSSENKKMLVEKITNGNAEMSLGLEALGDAVQIEWASMPKGAVFDINKPVVLRFPKETSEAAGLLQQTLKKQGVESFIIRKGDETLGLLVKSEHAPELHRLINELEIGRQPDAVIEPQQQVVEGMSDAKISIEELLKEKLANGQQYQFDASKDGAPTKIIGYTGTDDEIAFMQKEFDARGIEYSLEVDNEWTRDKGVNRLLRVKSASTEQVNALAIGSQANAAVEPQQQVDDAAPVVQDVPAAKLSIEDIINNDKWFEVDSPSSGGAAHRLDAADYSDAERKMIVEELNKHGLRAEVYHSPTFGTDSIQVRHFDENGNQLKGFEQVRSELKGEAPPAIETTAKGYNQIIAEAGDWQMASGGRGAFWTRVSVENMPEAQQKILFDALVKSGFKPHYAKSETLGQTIRVGDIAGIDKIKEAYANKQPESVTQSLRFNDVHRLEAHEPILYGYRDGGRGLKLDVNGKPLNAPSREIIVVKSPAEDRVFGEAVEYAKQQTSSRATVEEKVRFLNNYVDKLMETQDPKQNQRIMDRITGGNHVGKEISLGDLIEAKTGVCRHRSLLFKALADECGIPSALVRGNYHEETSRGVNSGGHAWNEVLLENNQKLLVDVMHDFVGSVSNPKAAFYFDMKDQKYAHPMYEHYLTPDYKLNIVNEAGDWEIRKKMFGLGGEEIFLSGEKMTPPAREDIRLRLERAGMNPSVDGKGNIVLGKDDIATLRKAGTLGPNNALSGIPAIESDVTVDKMTSFDTSPQQPETQTAAKQVDVASDVDVAVALAPKEASNTAKPPVSPAEGVAVLANAAPDMTSRLASEAVLGQMSTDRLPVNHPTPEISVAGKVSSAAKVTGNKPVPLKVEGQRITLPKESQFQQPAIAAPVGLELPSADKQNFFEKPSSHVVNAAEGAHGTPMAGESHVTGTAGIFMGLSGTKHMLDQYRENGADPLYAVGAGAMGVQTANDLTGGALFTQGKVGEVLAKTKMPFVLNIVPDAVSILTAKTEDQALAGATSLTINGALMSVSRLGGPEAMAVMMAANWVGQKTIAPAVKMTIGALSGDADKLEIGQLRFESGMNALAYKLATPGGAVELVGDIVGGAGDIVGGTGGLMNDLEDYVNTKITGDEKSVEIQRRVRDAMYEQGVMMPGTNVSGYAFKMLGEGVSWLGTKVTEGGDWITDKIGLGDAQRKNAEKYGKAADALQEKYDEAHRKKLVIPEEVRELNTHIESYSKSVQKLTNLINHKGTVKTGELDQAYKEYKASYTALINDPAYKVRATEEEHVEQFRKLDKRRMAAIASPVQDNLRISPVSREHASEIAEKKQEVARIAAGEDKEMQSFLLNPATPEFKASVASFDKKVGTYVGAKKQERIGELAQQDYTSIVETYNKAQPKLQEMIGKVNATEAPLQAFEQAMDKALASGAALDTEMMAHVRTNLELLKNSHKNQAAELKKLAEEIAKLSAEHHNNMKANSVYKSSDAAKTMTEMLAQNKAVLTQAQHAVSEERWHSLEEKMAKLETPARASAVAVSGSVEVLGNEAALATLIEQNPALADPALQAKLKQEAAKLVNYYKNGVDEFGKDISNGDVALKDGKLDDKELSQAIAKINAQFKEQGVAIATSATNNLVAQASDTNGQSR